MDGVYAAWAVAAVGIGSRIFLEIAHRRRKRVFCKAFRIAAPTQGDLANEAQAFELLRHVRMVLARRRSILHAVQRARFSEKEAIENALRKGEDFDGSRYERLDRRFTRLSGEFYRIQKAASYFLRSRTRAKTA